MKQGRNYWRLVVSLLAGITVVALAGPAPAASGARGDSTSVGTDRLTVADILERNPDARQIGPDEVEIAPGVALRLPSRGGGQAVAAESDCLPEFLCGWEHRDRGGRRLRFFNCGSYNLFDMRYPDGARGVPGPKWNDRLSSLLNNQTDGTRAHFYDTTGSGVSVHIFSTVAVDRRANLAYDTATDGRPMNDRIDRIVPC